MERGRAPMPGFGFRRAQTVNNTDNVTPNPMRGEYTALSLVQYKIKYPCGVMSILLYFVNCR